MVDSSFGTSCEYIFSVSQMHCYLNNLMLLDCYARGKDAAGRWTETLLVAYKTLGVVFGGLVTSPLYVYSSILPLKSPTMDEYFGIFSIMFWTLTLIGVVKYATIALRADDDGEGGTFALYSLLCRSLNITETLSLRPSNPKSSSLPRSIYVDTQNQTIMVKVFRKSIVARRLLLFITMLGMCMLIGDGILTPAISVRSAIDGIRGPFPSVNSSVVKVLSTAVLVILFMVQKYAPFNTTGPSIFKAVSPHYVIRFFWRNGKEGWLTLGGTVLCITGSEALFADLGRFNQSSIQIAFLFAIYPCLVVTYAGQTAYLINNQNDLNAGFYSFIPSVIYWPMFVVSTLAAIVASQSLISAVFSVIKQAVLLDYFPRVKVVRTSANKEGEVYSPEVNHVLMIISVAVIFIFGDAKDMGNAYGLVVSLVMLITTILLTLVMVIIWRTPPVLVAVYFSVFFIIEGVYVSAVFTKIAEGGWIPFAISLILSFIMFGWYYGRQRKITYELTHKITLDRLGVLLSDPSIQKVPGFCFFYTNIQDGITPVLEHYVKNMKSFHQVTVFTTLRYRLIPKVAPHERIIFNKLGKLKGVYGCVIQYGYADPLEGDDLVSNVSNCLRVHIRDGSADPAEMQQELSNLEEAISCGIVHVRGKTRFHIGKSCAWYDKIMLAFYEVLHSNCRPALGVPLPQCIEVGMLYEA
ncbi:hypothetical protein ACLB2K_055468 [Fragaria x ananassa]